MEGKRFNSAGRPFESANGIATARPPHPPLQPNSSCRKVQDALEHLASIDLIELCNESKVEHCRATRDLRSCGRYVQSLLNSCGHASLCEECIQRGDSCPICRIPIPKNGNRLRLRLYYECIEAGLISKRFDDRFQEKDGEKQPTADVERLYSFFDVALENNLISLIGHYITDVCMDEAAVSSDPVVALLLDEVVVKDWCKRTFKNIVADLPAIYNLTAKESKERPNTLLKLSVKFCGISNVLEVLESSFKGSLSAQLHDMHLLQESVLKTKQEACCLLLEISGTTTHPKVAQVLLERQNPYAALMVLRWSGRDGGTDLISFSEAVTAVRVRVECGLLIEAFMYQRVLCTKVKERKLRHELYQGTSNEFKHECQTWMNWLEVLVTEICILCIRRNLVDRIIGLPWNSDEEKHLHKSLLDYALENPSSTTGSLLVVFYLQRYRYMEAYQVDRKLQIVEQDFISVDSVSEEVEMRMRSASQWRAGLVDKSIQLLPEVEQQKVKSGQFPEVGSPANDINAPDKSDLPKVQEPIFTSLLVPSSVQPALALRADRAIPSVKPSIPETSLQLGGSISISHFTNHGSSTGFNVFNDSERGQNLLNSVSKNFNFDDIGISATRPVRHVTTTPLKEVNRSSSRISQNTYLENDWLSSVSTKKEQKGFQNFGPYFRRAAANPVTSLSRSNGVSAASPQDSYLKGSGKYVPSDRPARIRNVNASDDLMDISWSNKDERASEQVNVNCGPRWRSDDASDDEEQWSPDRLTGVASYNTPPSKGNPKKQVCQKIAPVPAYAKLKLPLNFSRLCTG